MQEFTRQKIRWYENTQKKRHFCIISVVEAPKINREHHHDKSVPEKSTKINDESQLNVHKQLIDELKYDDTSKSWHGTNHRNQRK